MIIKALTQISIALSLTLALCCGNAQASNIAVDSDSDGISDVLELRHGLDPNKPYDVWRDRDGDHLPDIVEYIHGLDVNSKDNDVYQNPQLLFMSAYIDIRAKMATPAQLAKLAKQNLSPLDIYSQLLDETHFSRMGFVGRVYQAILHRSPDIDGARYYYQMLGNGMTRLNMVQQVLGSKEFERKYGQLTAEQFIEVAHLSLLDRKPSGEESDYYLDAIHQQGLSKSQMMLVFIDTADYVEAFDDYKRVEMLSLLLTASPPNSAHLRLMTHWLKQEGHAKSVLRALLASNEFRLNRSNQMADIDSDEDGRFDGAEFIAGIDFEAKNNAVVVDDHAFVTQIFWDFLPYTHSLWDINDAFNRLSKLKNRSVWLNNFLTRHEIVDRHTIAQRLLDETPLSLTTVQSHSGEIFIQSLLQSERFMARFD